MKEKLKGFLKKKRRMLPFFEKGKRKCCMNAVKKNLKEFFLLAASAQKGPYAPRVRSVAEKAFSQKLKKKKITVKCFIVSSKPVYNIQREENSIW